MTATTRVADDGSSQGKDHQVPVDGRPAEPRLLGLRVHGFKSFAERTNVEFGPGISAIVGPNGSGKSNLADALRWAFGEQGRALRSRKAEDVIWAGSERRPAQGMADVSLLIDNADGLLPVDYQVLELGRRLYRSGENEYLLNRTRIRLRELVDLLDAAHLADNAFLFIGQGMVDQALALRPEERRPLFDEVAGVRRHERRRRRAEEQLTESEANLARVEDILAELRPQARRLAAQAEQQADRDSTGDELVSALMVTMHARWFDAAGRATHAARALVKARTAVERAAAELAAAEGAADELAQQRTARAAVEQASRDRWEAAQAAANALRLRDAALHSESDGLGRDRGRLRDERAAAEADLDTARRAIAAPMPPRDLGLEAAVAEAGRDLVTALEEVGALRGAQQARGQQEAAARRAVAAREAETETLRRRLAEAERRLVEETRQVAEATARRIELEAAHLVARTALEIAQENEGAAARGRDAIRDRALKADVRRSDADDRVAAASTSLASIRAQLGALEARLAEEEARGIAGAARRVGGRRLDEDLIVDPDLRAAVESALSEAVRAYVVGQASVTSIADERGHLVVAERTADPDPEDARERQFRQRLAESGGGLLHPAVRRDVGGVARRMLARAAWLPDLEACLAIQPFLPPGWLAVPRRGGAVVTELVVSLGAPESVLERRTEIQRLVMTTTTAESELARLRDIAAAAGKEAAEAAAAVDASRADESRAGGTRRAAEESERIAARRLETVVREQAWHEAQAERLARDVERASAAVADLAGATPGDRPEGGGSGSAPAPAPASEAVARWEARATELRGRRDRLAEDLAARDGARHEAEQRRARAEAALSLNEARLARADTELAALIERERGLSEARDSLAAEIAAGEARETDAREALASVRAADAEGRDRLDSAARTVASARDGLRAVEERLRPAERDDLEARLGLEAVREGILVELAGLGELGLARLTREAGLPSVPARMLVSEVPASGDDASVNAVSDEAVSGDAGSDNGSDDGSDDAAVSEAGVSLQAALVTVSARWSSAPPTASPPSSARLGQLRRRFHDLGAANPDAVGEYAALRTRVDGLEAQAADLRSAIDRTRELIVELDTMIGDRFRSTFRALESAFATRFEQLFGGGFARLSLTDPADVGASGIEIVARPPGKKPQALAMLSGGERALTAVALLFAMLEVRPVPFCVLDEVDAALDEANIGRFADALRSLAHQTQFIVITHNRGTIESADALYGVTSGDDSVSRVISLRLDEARALATRDPADLATAG